VDYSDVLIRIRKILRSVNLESRRIEKEYGVSIPQVLCLKYLKNCDGFQATHNDINKYLQLNASTTTGIINRLESKGLLARLPKSVDKGITNIVLTADGDKILAEIPLLMHNKLINKLNELPETELPKITNILDLIIQLLEIEEIEASPLLTIDVDLNS